MGFFGKKKKKAPNAAASPPLQQQPMNPATASQQTGNRMASLNDMGNVYTSPPQQDPMGSPQQQHMQHMQQMPPGQQDNYRQVKTSVNAEGRRVVTTTVRVPPKQQQQQQQPPMVRVTAQPHNPPQTLPPGSALPPKAPPAAAQEDSVTALTRDLVKKFIADIWNRGETELIPEVCSPSLRFNGNNGFDRVGHDGLARMVGTIRDALDDYHCEIHSMVVENNKAFCRLRFTGKHTGNLLGYEATGRTVAWMGATEFTCQNGKILKVWELGDIKSLEDQINPDNLGQEGEP